MGIENIRISRVFAPHKSTDQPYRHKREEKTWKLICEKNHCLSSDNKSNTDDAPNQLHDNVIHFDRRI